MSTMLVAHCKLCKNSWRVGEDLDLPPELEEIGRKITKATLEGIRFRCRTLTCDAGLLPVSALDLGAANPLVGCSPQDSSGNPIAVGDVVRFNEEGYRIEEIRVGTNEAGAPLLKLEGRVEWVSEWSIDLVQQGSEWTLVQMPLQGEEEKP